MYLSRVLNAQNLVPYMDRWSMHLLDPQYLVPYVEQMVNTMCWVN